MEQRDKQMAEQIAAAVAEIGGRVYYVGGLVRDHVRGEASKDIDIEVHGVLPSALEEILRSLGEVMSIGASFGIFGLRGYGIDIAMPRQEKVSGRGHRDFDVITDPFLGTRKAAMRRDFTVNSLMMDVLTGKIVDHFGGIPDLQKGVIRHVNDVSFGEDPLRVLRAAQFAARFGYTVAEETVILCRTMDLTALAGERIYAELEKALLKAEKPSLFFETLREMHQLSVWFPEAEALIGVPQEPRYHPEGDAWNHTMLVLDQAARLREKAEYPLGFMLAALCHDFGKAEAIQYEDGRIRALGHEEAGVPLAEGFLQRITKERRLNRYVTNMVELHMRPNIMAAQKSGEKSFHRLFDRAVSPGDLLLLAEADAFGRAIEQDYTLTRSFLQSRLTKFHEIMARPYVMGEDLVKLGFTPGADFREVLEYAHKMRLAGVPKEDSLRQTAAFLRKLRAGKNGEKI